VLLVCLGATATQTLLGKDARVTRLRGRVLEDTGLPCPVVVAITIGSVAGPASGRELREQLLGDLALAASATKDNDQSG
jgi:hypothetical protein